MAYSLPGFLVHGIPQARILEWVTISFSRRPSRPRDWTRVSHIVGRCFTGSLSQETLNQKAEHCLDPPHWECGVQPFMFFSIRHTSVNDQGTSCVLIWGLQIIYNEQANEWIMNIHWIMRMGCIPLRLEKFCLWHAFKAWKSSELLD